MFNLDPARSLCPAEIMRAGMKAKRRIFAKNRMVWPLVGFTFFVWSTQFKSGPPLSNNKCLIRKARCFLAVDARTVLLDEKNPHGGGVGGLF